MMAAQTVVQTPRRSAAWQHVIGNRWQQLSGDLQDIYDTPVYLEERLLSVVQPHHSDN